MSSLLNKSQLSLRAKIESVQLPPSCCGLLGAYCVCEALGVPYKMSGSHGRYINHRAHTASVGAYLCSRYSAGMTAETLADLTNVVSSGAVQSRFFPTQGTSARSLEEFLCFWLQEKSVLVLTLNLQMMDTEEKAQEDLADAWHHHPLAGSGVDGRFRMMYPEVEYSAEELHKMVDCESALLIRPQDILYETVPKGTKDRVIFPRKFHDVEILRKQSDKRWIEMGVLDAVYELLHEADSLVFEDSELRNRKRIKIPAVYQPGVTVFIDRSDAAALVKLETAPAITR